MVHAVCFNKKCFDIDVFERILAKTGGQDAGYLVNTLQNCIESFPDGKIYRSFQNRNDWITDKGIIDCGDDIEKFIYVNQYGKKGKDDDMDEFTTPEDAKRFVEETGVSCLAVAVGNAFLLLLRVLLPIGGVDHIIQPAAQRIVI